MALGRGLSALISTPVAVAPERELSIVGSDTHTETEQSAGFINPEGNHRAGNMVKYIELEKIITNPKQPRQVFDEQDLQELAASIRTLGVLQPVLVRRGEGDTYDLVAGERRWRASKLSGLKVVPAIVQEISDQEALEIALVENIQRADLNPIEEAEAYQRLMNDFSLSQQEISDRVGKDRASVANYVRLLKLPHEVVKLVREGKLSMGHAKAILTVKEPSAQISLAKKSVEEGLSVRSLEAITSRVVVMDGGKRSARSNVHVSGNTADHTAFPDATDRLRHVLGTKVTVKHHESGRGRIEIDYFSEAELDRLIEIICGERTGIAR